MWTALEFNTIEQLNDWVARYGHQTRWNVIFIENGYGLEYKKLKKI